MAERQKELLGEGMTGPEQHHESRPPLVEAEGVHHLMTFAELTGAHVYIVHLSCEEALARGARGAAARRERLDRDADSISGARQNLRGAARTSKARSIVMSPPLRDKRNQDGALERTARAAKSRPSATDHAPFDFKTQKPMGRDDFTKIPNGIPSLEERVNLLFTYGVKTGKLDLHTFVNVASTHAAKIFGLFPRKGTIQLGADADLVVYDPNYRGNDLREDADDERRLQRVRRLGISKAARAWSPCAGKSRRGMENLSGRSDAGRCSSASRSQFRSAHRQRLAHGLHHDPRHRRDDFLQTPQ